MIKGHPLFQPTGLDTDNLSRHVLNYPNLNYPTLPSQPLHWRRTCRTTRNFYLGVGTFRMLLAGIPIRSSYPQVKVGVRVWVGYSRDRGQNAW